MASPVLRGIVCPVNDSPTCLKVEIGDRGTDEAGRLILGLIIKPSGGILCSDEGLTVDECYIQANQFGRKYSKKFSDGLTFTNGLIP